MKLRKNVGTPRMMVISLSTSHRASSANPSLLDIERK